MDFEYIARTIRGPGVSEEEWEEEFQGCDCEVECTASSGCSCLLRAQDNYDSEGRLIDPDGPPILECHDGCSCLLDEESTCRNAVLYKGVVKKLEVFRASEGKGFGVKTKEPLTCGDFVCEYAGECIGRDEVERRHLEHMNEDNFTLTLKEHFGAETIVTFIDPRKKGNIGRFMNHSCEPNLQVVVVRKGTMIPVAGLFAKRNIAAGEELCYDYGESQIDPVNARKCLCSTPSCRGFLPMSLTASE